VRLSPSGSKWLEMLGELERLGLVIGAGRGAVEPVGRLCQSFIVQPANGLSMPSRNGTSRLRTSSTARLPVPP
jgi:hypothetical protein